MDTVKTLHRGRFNSTIGRLLGKDREMDKERTASRRTANRREKKSRRKNLLLWDLVENRKTSRRKKNRRELEAEDSETAR